MSESKTLFKMCIAGLSINLLFGALQNLYDDNDDDDDETAPRGCRCMTPARELPQGWQESTGRRSSVSRMQVVYTRGLWRNRIPAHPSLHRCITALVGSLVRTRLLQETPQLGGTTAVTAYGLRPKPEKTNEHHDYAQSISGILEQRKTNVLHASSDTWACILGRVRCAFVTFRRSLLQFPLIICPWTPLQEMRTCW